MTTLGREATAHTQGHVVFYARNARWRRSVAKNLTAAGHSHLATAEPPELRRLLLSQRFDLMALKVGDESEALEVAEALQDAPLPPHSIVSGSESALHLIERYHGSGTLRYSPGSLAPEELRRLVEASLSSEAWQETASESGAASDIEEIDLEEVIENAAANVYARAKRRQQRFNTVVEGPGTDALGDPVKLHRTLVSILELVVGLSPRGALVSVEARANNEDWTIRISASAQSARADGMPRLAEALGAETAALRSAYRDISAQGGLLWVEVSGRATLGVCLSLPLAPRSGEEPLPLRTGMAPAEGR